MEVLAWHNLVFLVPIAIAGLLVLALALGMSIDGHEADVHAHVPGDVDHGAHGYGEHGLLAGALSLLGIGKAPMSVILVSAMLIWGVAGLIYLGTAGPEKPGIAMAIAGVAALLGCRLVAEGLHRVLPSVESYYAGPDELVHLEGQVLYEVTPDSGTARVQDPKGNQRDIPCRVRPGEKRIPAGTSVRVREHLGEGVFHVG